MTEIYKVVATRLSDEEVEGEPVDLDADENLVEDEDDEDGDQSEDDPLTDDESDKEDDLEEDEDPSFTEE